MGVEALHDGIVAVEHHEGDVAADHQERDQLHHGLEGDRQHQAVLVFGRIRVARAEGDGEARQHEGDDEGEIADETEAATGMPPLAARQEHVERGRDRLQLQGDVGNRADEGDQADDGGDPFALAVAGRHEIGDGGDVLGLRHPHDPGDQRMPKPITRIGPI